MNTAIDTPSDRRCISIKEWCASVGLAVSRYHKHDKRKDGSVPRSIQVGPRGQRRRIIMMSAIHEWETAKRERIAESGGANG